MWGYSPQCGEMSRSDKGDGLVKLAPHPTKGANVIKLRKSKIVTGNKDPVTIFMNIM